MSDNQKNGEKLVLAEYEKHFSNSIVPNGQSKRIGFPKSFSDLLKLQDGEIVTLKIVKIRKSDGTVRWEENPIE